MFYMHLQSPSDLCITRTIWIYVTFTSQGFAVHSAPYTKPWFTKINMNEKGCLCSQDTKYERKSSHKAVYLYSLKIPTNLTTFRNAKLVLFCLEQRVVVYNTEQCLKILRRYLQNLQCCLYLGIGYCLPKIISCE